MIFNCLDYFFKIVFKNTWKALKLHKFFFTPVTELLSWRKFSVNTRVTDQSTPRTTKKQKKKVKVKVKIISFKNHG